MNIDNPVSREYLLNYPSDAARALEQVTAVHVAALFEQLPAEQLVDVLGAMLPEKAAACMDHMTASRVTRLLCDMPMSSAARIYKSLAQVSDEVAALLPENTRNRFRNYLRYSVDSAGALLSARYDTLPLNTTVSEAIHRVQQLEQAPACEIYVVDEAYRLVGSIELGVLLTSNHNAGMKDIINRKSQPVSAHASVSSLLSNPGWKTRRRLPVTERDGTLVGVIEYSRIRDRINDIDRQVSRDPLENMLALSSLYWLSMAQLLDGLLSIARPDRGGRA